MLCQRDADASGCLRRGGEGIRALSLPYGALSSGRRGGDDGYWMQSGAVGYPLRRRWFGLLIMDNYILCAGMEGCRSVPRPIYCVDEGWECREAVPGIFPLLIWKTKLSSGRSQHGCDALIECECLLLLLLLLLCCVLLCSGMTCSGARQWCATAAAGG